MDESNRKQLTLEGFMKLKKLRKSCSYRIQDRDEFKKQRHELILKNTPMKKKNIKENAKNERIEIHRKLLNGLVKFPGLYDKSHPDFNDNKERKNYWIQLTEYLDLEKSTDIIKSKVNNLIKKYKNEKENPNSTWELLNDARFLDAKFKDDPTEMPEDDWLLKPIIKNNVIDDDDEESEEDSVNNAVSSSNVHHIILDSSDEDDVKYSGPEEWPLCSPPQNEPKILSENSDISTQEVMNPENDTTFPDADQIKQEMEMILNNSQPDNTDNQYYYVNQSQKDDKNNEQVGSSSSVDFDLYKTSIIVQNNHHEVNEAFANYIVRELNNLPPLVASDYRKKIMKIFCDVPDYK